MSNRAERRAKQFDHHTGGVIYTNRAARGNKGKGKVKPIKRNNLDSNPAAYNADDKKHDKKHTPPMIEGSNAVE